SLEVILPSAAARWASAGVWAFPPELRGDGGCTITLYLPGKAPSLGWNVVRRKTPLASVAPLASRPPFCDRNITVAPARSLPSSLTVPVVGTVPLPKQPALTRAMNAQRHQRMRIMAVSPPGCHCGNRGIGRPGD